MINFEDFKQKNANCCFCDKPVKIKTTYCTEDNIGFAMEYDCCNYIYYTDVSASGIMNNNMSIRIGIHTIAYYTSWTGVFISGKAAISTTKELPDSLYSGPPIIKAKELLEKYLILL